MNKKFLVGFSVLSIAAGFWACGDGSVEAKSGDDELALANYGEFNPDGMSGLVSGAMSECEADPACVAKMEGSTYVPPEENPEGGEGGEQGGEQGGSGEGSTTPGGDNTPTSASSPATNSNSSTLPTSSASVTPPPTSSATVTPPASSATVTPPSSATVIPPSSANVTPPSSANVTPSSANVTPSSTSTQSSASSVDPTGATPIELVYGQTTTKLTGGKWSVTSNNQYSGILFCKANESVTVTADGNTITVTSSETNYGNIKPRSGSPVIIEVPDGKTIECRTDW